MARGGRRDRVEVTQGRDVGRLVEHHEQWRIELSCVVGGGHDGVQQCGEDRPQPLLLVSRARRRRAWPPSRRAAGPRSELRSGRRREHGRIGERLEDHLRRGEHRRAGAVVALPRRRGRAQRRRLPRRGARRPRTPPPRRSTARRGPCPRRRSRRRTGTAPAACLPPRTRSPPRRYLPRGSYAPPAQSHEAVRRAPCHARARGEW